MQWFMTALRKYAVFDGRARRKEFWFFELFVVLISIVLAFVDRAIGTFNMETGVGTLGALATLALIIPSLAVGARRLHDTDRSGWWQLLYITVIGTLVLLVFFLLDSKPGTNRFGPNPKGVGETPA